MVNSGIHVLMYTYYGLSVFGPAVSQYLWWKKYLTIMQLVSYYYISKVLYFMNIEAKYDFMYTFWIVLFEYWKLKQQFRYVQYFIKESSELFTLPGINGKNIHFPYQRDQ